MSTSDSDAGETDPAEPVDAEFEPAPEGEAAASQPSPEPRAKSGAGWFKVSLFVIAAAAIGGGSGWVAGQVLQAPIFTGEEPSAALEERLAALEQSAGSVSEADLDALQARIAALEEAQNASGLRADAMEQLVRDTADLRSRIEDLETRIPSGSESGEGAGAAGGDAASAEALAELESRMAEAFAEVETRFQTLEETAQAARQAGDEARSAAQQALNALATGGAGEPEADGGAREAAISALSGTINDLERRQDALAAELELLDTLTGQVESLEASAARGETVARLAERLGALEQAVRAIEQSADGEADVQRSLADRAIAFAALSEAAAGAEPFAAEYAELVRIWPDAPRRGALEPLARAGAPTVEGLQSRFPADALRAASGEADTYFGVLRIRREGAQGPAAAIEAALEAGDLAAAVEIAAALSGDEAASIAEWREAAENRLILDTALSAMARALRAQQEIAP